MEVEHGGGVGGTVGVGQKEQLVPFNKEVEKESERERDGDIAVKGRPRPLTLTGKN